MVRYAQDYVTCRKVLFERYFSLDAAESSEGLVNQVTPDQICGICDNCTRPKGTVTTQNIRPLAETIIRLCRVLKSVNERVTMSKLVQMLQGRGLGIAKSQVQQDSQIQIPIDRSLNDYVRELVSESKA